MAVHGRTDLAARGRHLAEGLKENRSIVGFHAAGMHVRTSFGRPQAYGMEM